MGGRGHRRRRNSPRTTGLRLPGGSRPPSRWPTARLRRIVETGGFRYVTLEGVSRAHRVGDDVRMWSRSSPPLMSPRPCFAGRPEDKVAAAVDTIREALTLYAGPDVVALDATAWLVSTHH